jgi:hypothetical protein
VRIDLLRNKLLDRFIASWNTFVLSDIFRKPSTDLHFSATLEGQNCELSFTFSPPVVLYGCENWSLALSDEHRLRVFENRVLRRIFGPKRDEGTGGWENCTTRSFVTCTLHKV